MSTIDIMEEDDKLSFLKEELEALGFTYDEDTDVVYSLPNCWQRNYGYHHSFDEIAASLNMILDFEPIYFDYNGKKWLIEIKKGHSCDEEKINEFCHDLPRYKRPKKIIFAKVPRNPTGKIEKPKLRQIYCGESLVKKQIEK
jgi:acyl-CoA synthetase (AMP-forming)/AMP-acid ligase II